MQGHGVLGLTLFTGTVSAMLSLLKTAPHGNVALMFVIPVVFQQFILIKNDLFGAVPAALVLTWIITRLRGARVVEFTWAGWLSGVALGVKLTSFPIVIVLVASVLVLRPRLSVIGATAAGGVLGGITGGVFFTLIENARMYGDALAPLGTLGNTTAGPAQSALSIMRFGISLFDLGLLTRHWWPGRGGWGGTYGLPMIWSLTVLLHAARRNEDARLALYMAAAFWILCASAYPDADIAHRYALAPGMMVIAVAVTITGRDAVVPNWLRQSAMVVGILSAAQILRSAALYLSA